MRVGDIAPAPWNPKTHPEIQHKRMGAVLDEFGIGDTLKAFYADDGRLTLFDGHLRQSLDDDQVWPVDITDYSEDEARRLVLYYDPMAALAERHEERWQDIAASFEERNEALAGWLDEMRDPIGEMPDFFPVDESEQPRLDQKAPITCPLCDGEFIPE
jgi:hypothetical protein